MRLKKIEINGFKSFQSKSILTIDSNLIGIVGPNGSGKSNIIDAVRWVLGEQSAKNLRGNSMKDVIFSGTEDIKGKNFAEVTIIFELENEEHSVTRRLYKNGDSDYLLNGKKAKLKDITDVYLDLGINKESYSIITQGKVENILSSKAQDRRIIIEEAAGILKYKNKKKETGLKLEKTQGNINRLKDIFIEIEARHNVLLEQKKKTELYLKYEQDLKVKDIALQVYNIKTYQNKLEDINLQLTELLEEKKNLEINISEVENIIKNNKTKIQENDLLYTEYKDRELSLVEEIGKLSSTIQLYEEKKNTNFKLKGKLEDDIKNLEQSKRKEIQVQSGYIHEIKKLKKELDLVKSKIKNEKNKSVTSVEEIDLIIDSLKNKYFDLANQESKLENEIILNQQILNNKKQNLEEVNGEVSRLESLMLASEEEFKNITKLCNDYQEKEKQVLKEKNLNLEKEKKLDIERTALIENISRGRELFNSTNNKKSFLENQYASDNYFNLGVKEILRQKKNIKGIYDILANVINTKSEYVIALDLALASSQQNIIVDTPDTARICVEHLKKSNKGRATFLPLASIKSRKMDYDTYTFLTKQEGFIDLAIKLIDYDNKFENVLSNILGKVVVCDNLYSANKIAQLLNYKYRIITLDGQVINNGGSISGGVVYKTTNSIIKYKSELENLTSKSKKLEEKVISFEKQLEIVDQECMEVKKSLNEQDEILKNLEKELTENKIKFETSKESLERLQMILSQEKIKLNSLENLSVFNSNKETADEKLLEIRKELELINLELEKEQDRKQAATYEKNDQTNYINELYIEESKLITTIKHTEALLERSEDVLDTIKIRLTELYSESEEKNREVNFIDKIPEVKNELIKYNYELDILKDKLLEIVKKKDELFYQDVEYNKKNKSYYKMLTEFNDNLEELKIRKSQFSVKTEEMILYLNNAYNLSYESAENIFSEVAMVDIPNYRDDVIELKSKMNALGNVNLNAIEEYNLVQDRYEFYRSEIDDLLDAKSKLESTINEIDSEVKERFISTFTMVSENFSRIYRELFKGGNAKMTLDNPENILETGINIMASPPGKNLQMLSLLSGGEKALTALSLLFAILEIRKSPFVILDEVEAALDDVNVSRFAKFLKTYAKENQFLVITHRRGTMEEMDKLYGVTMKEKGISYILSLDLNTILKEEFINE